MDQASALKLVASLALVVGAILAAAWMLRRAGWLRNAGPAGFRILGTHSFNARLSIVMVEIEGARLLLGMGTHKISLLHVIPGPAGVQGQRDTVPSRQAGPSFPAMLSGKLERH